MKNDELVLRYSRWKAVFPAFMGCILFLVGYAVTFEKIFGDSLGAILSGAVVGIFFLCVATLLVLLNVVRILMKPKVLTIDKEKLVYYYATFGSQRKQIVLSWENIEEIKLDQTIVYTNKEIADTSALMPTKISYINIRVKEGELNSYSMFKNNIFLNKTSTSLSIVLNPVAKFSAKEFQLLCSFYSKKEKNM